MGDQRRVVGLLKNHIYPTYQLHAYMANKKTTPQDGLRLAGLVVMEWLRQRLGENAPEELLRLPEPSSYLACGDEVLISLHMNYGFVIDIVSMPDKGLWSMQITEPDLGPDPGTQQQNRQAVPGRMIETNIGFRISGQRLECGFQTVISDPEGKEELAEVYRLAVIGRLAAHPDFGLWQGTKLERSAGRITTVEQLKNLEKLRRDAGNQLPCVVFTIPRNGKRPPVMPKFEQSFSTSVHSAFPPMPIPAPVMEELASEPPYDIETFAKYGISFCRTYQLADDLFDRAAELFKCSADPGDIFVIEPMRFGGAVRTFPYKPSSQGQKETMDALRRAMYTYPRGKTVSFGRVKFLSAAREGLLQDAELVQQQSEASSQEWAQRMARMEDGWQDRLREQEAKYAALAAQLERQKQYQARLEQEKEQLVQRHEKELTQYRTKLEGKDEDIAYLKRKLGQPKEHTEIADWVAANFGGRLLLHPKAVALLEDKSTRQISVELICDALDFLATDYWAQRYERISKEEMNSRCSEKYGRPFEIKPTGATSIEFTPSQYKIKYFPGVKGKPVESPLDYHLGVGNDPENLLRIYFLHDDVKKLIVVGSLPRHLRAVTIK